MDTKEIRKAATAIYLAVPEEAVAKDISNMLTHCADKIEELSKPSKEIEILDKSWYCIVCNTPNKRKSDKFLCWCCGHDQE